MSIKKDHLDHSQIEDNQEAVVNAAENLGATEEEVAALLAVGLPGVQAKLENTAADMPEEDLALANELADEDEISGDIIRERTSHMAPERKRLLGLFLTLSLLFVFLVSCAQPIEATDNPGMTPGTEVVVTEVVDVPTGEVPDNPTEIIPTPTTIPFSDLEIDYGRYAGDEAEVDPYIERAWVLINSFVIERDLAAPGAIEIIDVSTENIIVEVLPQGRTDDYPAGTSFTISFVDGHAGETLSVSIDGANAVAGGAAVELAIGANNLPVALDTSGDVVAYVDKETGQWTAGSIELAAEVVEVPYFEMSPAERLAESVTLVEAASGYSEEVFWYINGDTERLYPWYWSFDQEWKTTEEADLRGLPLSELDIYGETLPEQAIPGYENPDGSLVMVRDGVETVFPAEIFVPGLGNVSMRDLMTMGQDRLGDAVIDQLQTLFDPEASDAEKIQYDRLQGQREWANFTPGFYVNTNDIFPHYLPSSNNNPSPNRDIEDLGIVIEQDPASEFVVPIFSPETGDFMFFLNIQKASLPQSFGFEYSPGGEISADTLSFGGETATFQNGEFAILIENTTPESTHLIFGGIRVLGEGDPGIGEAPDIEAILNARTEQEIIDILNETRIIFSIAGRIFYPEN